MIKQALLNKDEKELQSTRMIKKSNEIRRINVQSSNLKQKRVNKQKAKYYSE